MQRSAVLSLPRRPARVFNHEARSIMKSSISSLRISAAEDEISFADTAAGYCEHASYEQYYNTSQASPGRAGLIRSEAVRDGIATGQIVLRAGPTRYFVAQAGPFGPGQAG